VIRSIAVVFLFEWKRALNLSQKMWWLVLAGFPVFIIGLVRYSLSQTSIPGDDTWRGLNAWMLFALIPLLVTMLGTLLWSTPVLSSELERRSWVYLAVRPNGSLAVLLGKYLAAVTWILPPAILGLTIAVPLAGTSDSWRIWWTMFRLVLLSCPAYAAVYLLFGVIHPRRAMVLGVAYSLFFEWIISFVPALINRITIQYRLRALAATWCDLKRYSMRDPELMILMGDEPAWVHVTVLVSLTVALLVVASIILRMREFTTSAESET
jgi:ABC-type transport system involved in multi-copper enzyme maturation permease subunit